MADFLRRYSLQITGIGLLVCSFQLMSMSIEDRSLAQLGSRSINAVLAPVGKVQHELFSSVDALWAHYVWLLGVEEERNELLGQVKQLEEANSKLLEYESENTRLRELLLFKEKTALSGIAATVIGRDPSNIMRTITIDRGSADGLREGLPVVDGHAVVGQITTVLSRSAKVLLLTDNSSAIDAIVQRNRAPGIIEGGSDRKLKLQYMLKDYEVFPGDRVISAGLSGVYPKGILIGVVSDVRTGADVPGLFQQIEITPQVDFRRLETVFVLLSGGEGGVSASESKDFLVETEAPVEEKVSQ